MQVANRKSELDRTVKQKEADNVTDQACTSDNDDELWVRHLCEKISPKHFDSTQAHEPGTVTIRLIASRPIEKQSASKNTPFIKAPSTSARCHPYEYFELDMEFSASFNA